MCMLHMVKGKKTQTEETVLHAISSYILLRFQVIFSYIFCCKRHIVYNTLLVNHLCSAPILQDTVIELNELPCDSQSVFECVYFCHNPCRATAVSRYLPTVVTCSVCCTRGQRVGGREKFSLLLELLSVGRNKHQQLISYCILVAM